MHHLRVTLHEQKAKGRKEHAKATTPCMQIHQKQFKTKQIAEKKINSKATSHYYIVVVPFQF